VWVGRSECVIGGSGPCPSRVRPVSEGRALLTPSRPRRIVARSVNRARHGRAAVRAQSNNPYSPPEATANLNPQTSPPPQGVSLQCVGGFAQSLTPLYRVLYSYS
jgi:hypothetical protein